MTQDTWLDDSLVANPKASSPPYVCRFCLALPREGKGCCDERRSYFLEGIAQERAARRWNSIRTGPSLTEDEDITPNDPKVGRTRWDPDGQVSFRGPREMEIKPPPNTSSVEVTVNPRDTMAGVVAGMPFTGTIEPPRRQYLQGDTSLWDPTIRRQQP
jgi:hypothetical protein